MQYFSYYQLVLINSSTAKNSSNKVLFSFVFSGILAQYQFRYSGIALKVGFRQQVRRKGLRRISEEKKGSEEKTVFIAESLKRAPSRIHLKKRQRSSELSKTSSNSHLCTRLAIENKEVAILLVAKITLFSFIFF